MKIIKPSYEILTPIDRITILKEIEQVGRTCYKSEGKTTEISYSDFVNKLVKRGHLAMIEFFDITVKFIHNRGFLAELSRHRLASLAVESTRYISYKEGITVIEPYWMDEDFMDRDSERGFIKDNLSEKEWNLAMLQNEASYQNLIELGLSPQASRGVLPIDLKTEINFKANLREWKHIFELRCSSGAHPDMRRVMISLRDELAKKLPEIFGDLVK